MDTIFALATARGKAGLSVVRISGPDAKVAAQKLAGDLPDDRQVALRSLRGSDGVILDRALVVPFGKNASFTGDATVELHLHGSQAVVAGVLAVLGEMSGLRMAEPGEFTRRALENDRLDLAQVEGLADLIDAETETQRRQAMRVLTGALGKKAETWRSALIRAAALIEATIDFADEDVPVDVTPDVLTEIDSVLRSLEREIAGVAVAERIRDGFEVAIVGAPNVGKSTLLNALAGREAAITSPMAGTTRDVIEVRLDVAGLPITFLDTAGLRTAGDAIEQIGVERARSRAKAADLRIFLVENHEAPPMVTPQADDIFANAKVDTAKAEGFGVSGKTGAGIDELLARVQAIFEGRTASAAIATKERHRIAMSRARDLLKNARPRILGGGAANELAAEDLRTAIRALDSLVGRVDVEHILDEIFASFCLGK
jgi:tRNA modification GTPase